MTNKEKKKLCIFQFASGLLLIGVFIYIKISYQGLESYLDMGIVIGVGGMSLFWGVREVLGALYKNWRLDKKITKQKSKEEK